MNSCLLVSPSCLLVSPLISTQPHLHKASFVFQDRLIWREWKQDMKCNFLLSRFLFWLQTETSWSLLDEFVYLADYFLVGSHNCPCGLVDLWTYGLVTMMCREKKGFFFYWNGNSSNVCWMKLSIHSTYFFKHLKFVLFSNQTQKHQPLVYFKRKYYKIIIPMGRADIPL